MRHFLPPGLRDLNGSLELAFTGPKLSKTIQVPSSQSPDASAKSLTSQYSRRFANNFLDTGDWSLRPNRGIFRSRDRARSEGALLRFLINCDSGSHPNLQLWRILCSLHVQRLEVKPCIAMRSTFCRPDGLRVCLLSVSFARDRSAINLAETIVKMQGKRTARVVVWREDEVIFETPELLLLH